MIINYLELNNFRQFVNNQKIFFSTDPNKKVTLIMAESGVGKTTLIQCFQWVLYGDCKYKTILNEEVKNSLQSNQTVNVKCSINLLHSGSFYTITRIQKFFKYATTVKPDGESELIVDIKGKDGITRQEKGKNAKKYINDIIYRDLFPYFFLEGENLTKVGEQMSKGNIGTNNEFVKAVKGLLGFNYLYETIKHLTKLSLQFQKEIADNTVDNKLKDIISQISNLNNRIVDNQNIIKEKEKELEYLKEKREDLYNQILKYGALEEKQKRTKALREELSNLDNKINELRLEIFKRFSSQGVYMLMESLISKANQTLINANAIEKGIPGVNVSAIQHLLKQKKCLCGTEFIEGSKEWNCLNDWIKYLPPNNIGFEIEKFKTEMNYVENSATLFFEDYQKYRKELNNLTKNYNSKSEELSELNEEIGSYSFDISKLKKEENECNEKISDSDILTKKINDEICQLKMQISGLEKQQSEYKILDEKTRKIQSYRYETDFLKKRIVDFCERKEKITREQLEKAINDIFSEFYREDIRFEVDSVYNVQIKTSNTELLEDFTSGGQDVAVALAFIGGIIKLNKEKINSEQKKEQDIIGSLEEPEMYPLVMDAPTSNFGMKQMNSFSQIMPKITDQIIVFINDKDGPILIERMKDQIGIELHLSKIDTYHTVIKEV